MASFSRKTGIIGALVIAGVLIVGSIVLSGAGLSFLNPSTANAASTQALLQELATRDSSNSGAPDWEVELYGGDPSNPHSFSPTLTNGQAIAEGLVKPKFLTQTPSNTDNASSTSVQDEPDGITATPNSLTQQFAQYLLTQYLAQSASDQSNGTQPSDSDIATLAQSAMQTFAQQHEQQDVYALTQVQTAGTGPAALTTYAVAAEKALAANTVATDESELDYFSDAIEKNDPTALAKVVAIGKAYTTLAPALMQIKVPTEAQYAHLEIANAAARLGGDITDLGTMNTDPLRAYIGLSQYQTDAASLAKGFSDMAAVFSSEGVTIVPGDPGYFFLNAADKIQAETQN